MTTPILQAKGICKYFGPITALEDVDLQVSAGEVLGVIGDNGAGTVSYTHLTLPTILLV